MRTSYQLPCSEVNFLHPAYSAQTITAAIVLSKDAPVLCIMQVRPMALLWRAGLSALSPQKRYHSAIMDLESLVNSAML